MIKQGHNDDDFGVTGGSRARDLGCVRTEMGGDQGCNGYQCHGKPW